MKKGFYPHLAFDGIRKNKRLYLPYILTQIGMIMMYYIVIFLRYGKSLEGTFGDKTVNVVLMFGGWVIAIFACIFLFYTFIIGTRQKTLDVQPASILYVQSQRNKREAKTLPSE